MQHKAADETERGVIQVSKSACSGLLHSKDRLCQMHRQTDRQQSINSPHTQQEGPRSAAISAEQGSASALAPLH